MNHVIQLMASTLCARFQVCSIVRGYHKYQYIWDAVVGEILPCNCETGNVHNPYAVSIKKGGVIVGHVPKKLLCCVHYFCNGVALSVVK